MMQVSNVSEADGRACAQLLNFLKAGRWDLTGMDAEKLIDTKRWVAQMAQQMAEQLRAGKPATSGTPEQNQTMRVKAIGPIANSSKSKKKR